MYEIRESEMSIMNAQEMADKIAMLVTRSAELGLGGAAVPAIMLWGAPGVGKSQGVHQAAAQIEAATGRKTVVTDVRLLLFSPVDLRGIPVADSNHEFAVWLRPKIFEMDKSPDVINILFLDELTAAPQSVQAAAYQITLDRRIGEHCLPDNCVVIAAGNRVTDRSVSVKMPKALANRMCHIQIEPDFAAWREWALEHDIDMSIVGYLSYEPESLMRFGTVDDNLAFPTPRAWQMASSALKLCGGSVREAMPFIVGCVGKAAAESLNSWTRVWDKLPDIKAIFRGANVECPKKPDLLYALVAQMIAYARKEEVGIQEIRRSVHFGTTLPADYAMLLFRGYLTLQGKCSGDMRSELIRENSFREWINKNAGRLSL